MSSSSSNCLDCTSVLSSLTPISRIVMRVHTTKSSIPISVCHRDVRDGTVSSFRLLVPSPSRASHCPMQSETASHVLHLSYSLYRSAAPTVPSESITRPLLVLLGIYRSIVCSTAKSELCIVPNSIGCTRITSESSQSGRTVRA